ncbi:MAG: hypothetical protein GWN34_19775 [Gammaproteobacteria bacterium]|nr:hypothetical protein [Gammaproteobacteria bacterium]
MDLRMRSEAAVKDVCEVMSVSPTDEQAKGVADVIEQTIIDAILETTRQSRAAAVQCCSADADMAHKISREIEQSSRALIANLSSLR